MTTKIICDKCGDEIYGYSLEYNNIRFKQFVHERTEETYYGPHLYEKDLCDRCMAGLVKFLEKE